MIYSQRDNRWKDEKIGNSNSSIGNYGCTITCIAMLAEITPSEVNKRLTGVNGFLYDLVIWTKIEEAIPWLKFEFRGWTYDNSKVTQAIENNGACLVQVDWDGSPRTTRKHWVLFIGDKKMQDPWTGTTEPTSKYPLLTGYSLINKGKMTDLEVCLEQHVQLVKEAGEKDKKIADLEKKIAEHKCPEPIIPEKETITEYIVIGGTTLKINGMSGGIPNYAVDQDIST